MRSRAHWSRAVLDRIGVAALVVAGGLLVAGGGGGSTAAPAGPPGRLVQASGKLGCVHVTGAGGCTRGRGVRSPSDIAVSPDGRYAYVAGFESNAIAVFARDRRSGALRQLAGPRGCVSHRGVGACEFGRALAAPIDVAVSPDGRNVYVASTGSDALAAFARNRRTGALRQLAGAKGCISQRSGGGCLDGRALNEPIVVEVSRNGKRLYVASRQFPSAVAVFVRGRGGALTQPAGQAGCISQGGTSGCAVGRGLREVWDIAESRDGKNVYALGSGSDSVAVLRRTAAGLSQDESPAGCLARTPAEGCTTARAVNDPTGVVVSSDAKTVYVASFESDAVAILRRNLATGTLTQPAGQAGCISQAGGGGCRAGRALDGAHNLAASPDGRNLYVVAEEINAMSIFARDRSTGRLTQLRGRWACFIRGGVLGCPPGRGLTGVTEVNVSPDGRNVYAASGDSDLGAIAAFRRLR